MSGLQAVQLRAEQAAGASEAADHLGDSRVNALERTPEGWLCRTA